MTLGSADDGQGPGLAAHGSWETLGLHHWSVLALLFGVEPPPIDEDLVRLPVAERAERIAGILGLSAAMPTREVMDSWGNVVYLSDRIIEKLRTEAYVKRVPLIPWAPHAVQNAVEVWEQSVTPPGSSIAELRRYYLAPLAGLREHECYIAIAGEDKILFNIIRADGNYANNIRQGRLLQRRDAPPCIATCCEQFTRLRRELVQARAEILDLRQKNRKLKTRIERHQANG